MNESNEDLAALESFLGAGLRDVFLETFKRRFGDPPDEIRAYVDTAHVMELKEWIPNIVSAETPDDIFYSDLGHALTQFAAAVDKRERCMSDAGADRTDGAP